jgi:hypothetical protein
VFKMIHQGVVLCAAQYMKANVTKDIMTKDIRGADGWRINIEVRDFVQISHIRREQSLDQWGDTTNHFEFEWEVRATFDANMREMTASQVKILDLHMNAEMGEEMKADLRSRLVGDLIIT